MEYKNHKITEAVCAFRFDPSKNEWDVTRFAEYYNIIKNEGFEKKQEIKPFEFSLEVRPNIPPAAQLHEKGINMVYKRHDERYAILQSANYISFHSMNHYPGWEVFNSELIENFIKKYFETGLGKGLISAQMIYINNFQLTTDKDLSDYISFVPKCRVSEIATNCLTFSRVCMMSFPTKGFS